MSLTISGLHHVTAISGNARLNASFYTQVLGLRLVKRTVNLDDRDTFHLYYGDAAGRPGTLVTFFVRLDQRQSGRTGNRQVTGLRFGVPPTSLDYWAQRLGWCGVQGHEVRACGDAEALSFRDPEGLTIALVGAPGLPADGNSSGGQSPHAIHGLHGIELTVPDLAPTYALLTDVMGLKETGSRANWRRLAAPGNGPGMFVDLQADAELPDGSIGVGSVHHVAFRARDAEQQHLWQRRLRQAGLDVTEVRDRKYFRSIYFSEPGGIRFEIATDAPGFAVDEEAPDFGSRLQLPASLEPVREALEARLGALPTSSA